MDFTGKSAIVTGAGKGIGLKICEMLVSAGAHVVINDADDALAHQAAEATGGIAVGGDCANHTVIQKMVDTAVDRAGKLDIAIANAGITLFGEFLEYSPRDFSRVMDVNLGGTFFLAQASARHMKAHGGTLLFMSSVTGHQAHRNLAAYGMSKAAIEMLARNLVIELSEFNISVNTIAPGATTTERTLEDPDYHETWSRLTPMGRPASVEDIAHAALFLVSDQARHITGQTLVVDGGWSAISPSPY